MMKITLRVALTGFACLAVAAALHAQQMIVGSNVNVIAGVNEFTGDPFLQRQNEPAAAVSTRNSDHMIVAANDYRTIDMNDKEAETPEEASSIPGAWIGVYFSYDGGRTHFSGGLVPGYLEDSSPAGKASPVHGLPEGSDPVIAAGP